jgi:esterase/lipase superfamily enzyme
VRKSTVVIFNQLNIKNNKIDKENFLKNYNNKKNNVGKHFSNQRYFKEKNYKAKFSTNSV